ncbi:PilZ domain-containing protein [Spirochaeta dissipatitropha]
MEQERRKVPRYELNQLVELDYGRENFINGEGLDISARGIGCKVYECVELYSRLYFMLQLDPDAPEPEIRGEGILIRCDPTTDGDFEVGIEFTDVPEYMLKKISTFLEDPGES